MRKIILFMVGFLLLSNAFAVRECVYDPRGLTFHCTNNKPGEEIIPGEAGNITIACCFTDSKYLNSDEMLEISVEVVGHWTHSVQNPDHSWNDLNDTYPASQWITKVDFPNSSKGFNAFPVTIHYELPETSPLYKAGALIPSRVDIMIETDGGITPNNAIYPQIRIPLSYEGGLDFMIYLIGGLAIGLVSLFSVSIVKKKKKSKRMKQALQ